MAGANEKAPMKTMVLKYKGIFDLDGVYNYIYKFLKDRLYDVQEKRYKNKPDSPWGFEHEIDIVAFRKVDEYYMYHFKCTIHARDCTDVIHNGEKLTNGRVSIEMDGSVERDWQKRFSGNRFMEFLGVLYNRMTQMHFELARWDVQHYELHGLQEELKKLLNMHADTNYYQR